MKVAPSESTFIALDVETANRFRGSICEIGLVKFSGGTVVERFSTLIRPHKDYDKFEFTGIHGIAPSDVSQAPTLPEAWGTIWSFIGNDPFVAHNASFDVGALFDASGYLGLEVPRTQFYCSLVLARKVLGLSHNRLGDLAAHFDINQTSAHRAEDDAFVAGQIICSLLERTATSSVKELASKFGVAPGTIDTNTNIGSKVISEFSDHSTSLARRSPQLGTPHEFKSDNQESAISRNALLTWINAQPDGSVVHDGMFHGHEVYFRSTGGKFTPWRGQQIVALYGGLSSTRHTKFTSLVVCEKLDFREFESSKVTLWTPEEFIEKCPVDINSFLGIPKPSIAKNVGEVWIHV